MKTVALGDLVAPALVKRAGGAEYPVLSMTMRDGLVAQAERFKKRIASLDISDYKVVRHGQLVVGFPINEGVLDFQLHHDVAVVSPAYGVWDLRDESQVDRSYLKRFLRSPRAIEYYVGKMKGSTARRRSLPAADFNAMQIPLPSLSDQRRISEILDQGDTLRTKRRQVLTHLDSLSQAIFQDMFGERIASVGRDPLGELAEVITKGTTPTSVGLRFAEGGVPFLRVQNLQNGTVRMDDALFIDEEAHAALRRSWIAPGDLLISIAGTIGRVSIVPAGSEVMNCNQAVAIVRLRDPIDGPWLRAWLDTPDAKAQIGASSVKATISNLSLAQIRALRVPRFSADEKADFRYRVAVVDDAYQRATEAALRLDQLLDALESRGFRGEL